MKVKAHMFLLRALHWLHFTALRTDPTLQGTMTTPRSFYFARNGWHSFYLWDGLALHSCGQIAGLSRSYWVKVNDLQRDLVAYVDLVGDVQMVRGVFSGGPPQLGQLTSSHSEFDKHPRYTSLATLHGTLFAASNHEGRAIFAADIDSKPTSLYEAFPPVDHHPSDVWYTRLLVLDGRLLQLCSTGDEVEWRVFEKKNPPYQSLTLRQTVPIREAFDVGEYWDIAVSTHTLMLFTTAEIPYQHALIVFFDRNSLQVMFTVYLGSPLNHRGVVKEESFIVHFDGWGRYLALCDANRGVGLFDDVAIRTLASSATAGQVTLRALLDAGRWLPGFESVDQLYLCSDRLAAVLPSAKTTGESNDSEVKVVELPEP